MPKNIVVLSDGTGQVGGKGHDTNIYKLFRMLEDRTDKQIVFYDQGIGTERNRLAGMAFGRGFDTNVLQCYRFIFDHYQSGDKIFLFGFSRGAATVRSLANFIHYFGILAMSRPELIVEAYRLYQNRKQPRQEVYQSEEPLSFGQKVANRTFKVIDNAAFAVSQFLREDLDEASAEFLRQHPNQWVNIDFLGVWDTVPALGLVAMPGLDGLLDRLPAWKHRFHDFKLHPSVRTAYHALSLDDNRKWFLPTIWKEYDPKKQKVEQVWFGGAHTDVGGGFWQAGYSDISLEWMIQKALQHGLRLYLDSRRHWNFCVAPDPTDAYHDPRLGWGRIYARGLRDRVWDEQAMKVFGPPRIHASVLKRAAVDATYDPPLLKNYPDVDAWFEQAYKDELRKKYEAESQEKYEAWYVKNYFEKGKKCLPTVHEWRKQRANSYETWLAKNKASLTAWQHEKGFLCGDYRGRKVLVEPDEPVILQDKARTTLRDYDSDTLPTRLESILEDRFAHENLWARARRRQPPSLLVRLRLRSPEPDIDRLTYDADRWSKSASR